MSTDQPISSISVIIPAFNEEEVIGSTVRALAQEPGVEIIVADGGSTDRTVAIAAQAGARVIPVPKGRARQMNAGAAAAEGDILLFLHADTHISPGFSGPVRRCLANQGVVAGAFKLVIDLPGHGLIRLIERLANWRASVLQMPYGDQAIFMSRRNFQVAGGFPVLEIMEDFALVRLLKTRGRIQILKETVITSGRRWRQRGVIRTTLLNQVIIGGYLLGFSAKSLARLYRSSSRASF